MKKYFLLLTMLFFAISFAQDKKVETSQEFQNNLNKEYADRKESPLTEEDFKVFKALDFYPINEKFMVEATFLRTKKEKVFEMKTSTTRLPKYKKYGELSFVMDGKNFKLNVKISICQKKKDTKIICFYPFQI